MSFSFLPPPISDRAAFKTALTNINDPSCDNSLLESYEKKGWIVLARNYRNGLTTPYKFGTVHTVTLLSIAIKENSQIFKENDSFPAIKGALRLFKSFNFNLSLKDGTKPYCKHILEGLVFHPSEKLLEFSFEELCFILECAIRSDHIVSVEKIIKVLEVLPDSHEGSLKNPKIKQLTDFIDSNISLCVDYLALIVKKNLPHSFANFQTFVQKWSEYYYDMNKSCGLTRVAFREGNKTCVALLYLNPFVETQEHRRKILGDHTYCFFDEYGLKAVLYRKDGKIYKFLIGVNYWENNKQFINQALFDTFDAGPSQKFILSQLAFVDSTIYFDYYLIPCQEDVIEFLDSGHKIKFGFDKRLFQSYCEVLSHRGFLTDDLLGKLFSFQPCLRKSQYLHEKDEDNYQVDFLKGLIKNRSFLHLTEVVKKAVTLAAFTQDNRLVQRIIKELPSIIPEMQSSPSYQTFLADLIKEDFCEIATLVLQEGWQLFKYPLTDRIVFKQLCNFLKIYSDRTRQVQRNTLVAYFLPDDSPYLALMKRNEHIEYFELIEPITMHFMSKHYNNEEFVNTALDECTSTEFHFGLLYDVLKTYPQLFHHLKNKSVIIAELLKKAITSNSNDVNLYPLIRTLHSLGFDFEQSISDQRTAEISCTLLEYCILLPEQKFPVARKVATILLELDAAVITPRVARFLKQEIAITKSETYVPCLLRAGISESEVQTLLAPPPPPNSPEDLCKKMMESIDFMELNIPLYNLNVSFVDFSKIDEIRILKKDVKEAKEKYTSKVLSELYEKFCSKYDLMIEKIFFIKQLRELSRDIRRKKVSDVPLRLRRFYSLMDENESYSINKEGDLRILNLFDPQKRSYLWNSMRRKALQSYQRILGNSRLSLFPPVIGHGSKSQNIYSILKINGIAPMNYLLTEGIERGAVPWAGEACGSDKSLNKTSICVMRPTKNWSEIRNNYLDAATNLLVCHAYATKKYGFHKNPMTFDQKTNRERLSLESIKHYFFGKEKFAPEYSLTSLELDIIRFRLMEPDNKELLDKLKEYLNSTQKNESKWSVDQTSRKNIVSGINALLKTIDRPLPSSPTVPEKNLILNPYPIILASHTAKPKDFGMEHLIEGFHALGTDIQYIFTQENKIKELQGILPKSVSVYPLEDLFVLEIVNMMRGTEVFEEKETKLPVQKRLSKAFQRDILPFYTRLYPEKFELVEQIRGRYLGVGLERYDQYVKKVKSGEILARNGHGTMHGAMTGLLTQMILNITKSSVDRFKMGVTGGAHDLAREDDGTDLWDPMSGDFLYAYFMSLGYEPDEIMEFVNAVKNKDSDKPEHAGEVREILYDADCLQMMRFFLNDFNKFQAHRLYFMKNSKVTVDKDALLKEIFEFTKMVEDFKYKMQLEKESKDFYGDLLRKLNDNATQFPILTATLTTEIKEILS